MSVMFSYCHSLETLDLSSFETANGCLTTRMFYMDSHRSVLKTIYVSEKWNRNKITNSAFMFAGCEHLTGGAGTAYNANRTDVTYACIDRAGQPGYFTAKCTLTITDTQHGTVIADKTGTVIQGETVTLNVTPDADCWLKTLTVTDADDNEVEVTDNQFTMPDTTVTVTAVFKAPVNYLDGNGAEQSVKDYTVLDEGMFSLEDGWYVVDDDIFINERIQISGDVHLILCDGSSLIANSGIRVSGSGNSLTIYGQSNDISAMGSLDVPHPQNYFAGIGGNRGEDCSAITINGGNISSYGGGAAAAIGNSTTNFRNSSSVVTINGGYVRAVGENIGICATNSITVNGGYVKASYETGGYQPYGMISKGDITLSWRNKETDGIWEKSCISTRGSIIVGKYYIEEDEGTILAPGVYTTGFDRMILAPYSHFIGHSLTLDGDIGVNFYLELTEAQDTDDISVQFSWMSYGKQQEVTVPLNEAAPIDGDYRFTCRVSACAMNEPITAALMVDGSAVETDTYSVREYAEVILSDSYRTEFLEKDGNTEEDYNKSAALVRAMLNYGDYAKEYFDKTDRLDPLGDVMIDSKFATCDSDLPENLFDGATLSLKSKTTLSLYFTDTDELTFTCVDENERVRTVETVRDGETQIARIRNIAAAELQDSFTVTVKKGETTIGAITYSPMNYCYKALNGGTTDERLINAVKALVAYADATKVYFG